MIKYRSEFSVLLLMFMVMVITGCSQKKLTPVRTITDISIGETRDIKLSNGETVKFSLLGIKEIRDSIRNAIRGAEIRISVDGTEANLNVGNYNLPVVVGKVQVDGPILKAHYENSKSPDRVLGDAQFRCWPAGSPYINPRSFVYPIKQEWLASMSQCSNEPTYVDWAENVSSKTIYYHYGHDIGGAEGMDEIVSATDGIVVCSAQDTLDGYTDFPGDNRSDVVYIMDKRNWYYRYSHLDSIYPEIRAGTRVRMGDRIGLIGKQGGSGGWVHLHFQISTKDSPSGKWNTEDAFPYVWEAYINQYKPAMIAVARPHHLLWAGMEATLDGRKSKSFVGEIRSFEWIFTDGSTASGPVTVRKYDIPGEYSEILKVTDSKGNIDYDFTVVQVFDRLAPEKIIPAIQPAYHPTLGIKPGTPVTFLVRTFNTDVSNETWDFGDGSSKVNVRSEKVDRRDPRKGKFAETVHSFSKPGHYVVRVERSNENVYIAIGHLHVTVGE